MRIVELPLLKRTTARHKILWSNRKPPACFGLIRLYSWRYLTADWFCTWPHGFNIIFYLCVYSSEQFFLLDNCAFNITHVSCSSIILQWLSQQPHNRRYKIYKHITSILYSWFQSFVVFWMLYAFLWVIPRRLNFICQSFGPLWLFHLHRRVGGKDRVFRNVGIQNSDAGELPRRKHTTRVLYEGVLITP